MSKAVATAAPAASAAAPAAKKEEVAEEKGKSEEEARTALEGSEGDIAEAIMSLKE